MFRWLLAPLGGATKVIGLMIVVIALFPAALVSGGHPVVEHPNKRCETKADTVQPPIRQKSTGMRWVCQCFDPSPGNGIRPYCECIPEEDE
jgi:hypothetical protein